MKTNKTTEEKLSAGIKRINTIWKQLGHVFPRWRYNGSSRVGEQVLKMTTLKQVTKWCNEQGYPEDYTEHMIRRWFITQLQRVDHLLVQYVLEKRNSYVKPRKKTSKEIGIVTMSDRGSYHTEYFNLRSTRWPSQFEQDTNIQDMLQWMYVSGAATGRTSAENRLYLICDDDATRLNWKAKAIAINNTLSTMHIHRCRTPWGTYSAVPIIVSAI